jgi:hypothetical protein
MTRSRSVLALVVLVVLSAVVTWGCQGACSGPAAPFVAALGSLIAGAVNGLSGAPLLPTNPAGNACSAAGSTLTSPGSQGEALDPGNPSACSYDGDDVCAICVLAHCCAEGVACNSDAACACNIACNTLGPEQCPDSKRAEECGAEDAVYDDAVSCIVGHCHEECPAQ